VHVWSCRSCGFLDAVMFLGEVDFTSCRSDLLQVTRVVRDAICTYVVIEIVVIVGRKFAIYCRLGCTFGRRRSDFSVTKAESSGSHT
jgi:hypothetical protein